MNTATAPIHSCVLPSAATALSASLDIVVWALRNCAEQDSGARLARQRLTNLADALRQGIRWISLNDEADLIAHVLGAHSGLSDYERTNHPQATLCCQRDAFTAVRVLLTMVGYLEAR